MVKRVRDPVGIDMNQYADPRYGLGGGSTAGMSDGEFDDILAGAYHDKSGKKKKKPERRTVRSSAPEGPDLS